MVRFLSMSRFDMRQKWEDLQSDIEKSFSFFIKSSSSPVRCFDHFQVVYSSRIPCYKVNWLLQVRVAIGIFQSRLLSLREF